MTILSQPVPLVLASSSPIRAQMLKSVGLQFSVVPSNVDEGAIKEQIADAEPTHLAAELARAKCLFVSQHYPDHITIGSDQVCAMGSHIINKPMTTENAVAQLKEQSGKTHHQHSAVCIAKGDEVIFETVQTATLTMRDLSDEEITAYVHHDKPLQSCGSYKFEGMGRHLFASVEGDHDVIQGLPLIPVLLTLYQHGALAFG